MFHASDVRREQSGDRTCMYCANEMLQRTKLRRSLRLTLRPSRGAAGKTRAGAVTQKVIEDYDKRLRNGLTFGLVEDLFGASLENCPRVHG